ncbi:MAG TPA: type IV pilin protein [Gammaproteobacteria bacterium]
MHHKDGCAGFGLMDVLIALAIVAILATLAYPDYREYVARGRRMDAVTTLLRVQVAQEQWRANHSEYAALADLDWIGELSVDGYYRLRLSRQSAAGFLALAEPRTGGPQQDDACGVFAIDQRGPVHEGYAAAACWRR